MRPANDSRSELVSLLIKVPRSELTVHEPRPLLVTNANSDLVLGLTRRQFLDLLPDLERDGIHVVRRGKLRAVLLEDLERWFRGRREEARPSEAAPLHADPDVAEIAREFAGCRK